jgi:hypothetical protein
MQLVEWPNIDVVKMLQPSSFEQNHQVSAAGERFPNAGFVREH